MADLDDASGAEKAANAARKRLDKADINPNDRAAIQRFVKHRKIHGSEQSGTYSLRTEAADLDFLRKSSERADIPILEMGIDDVNDLIQMLTDPKDAGGFGVTTGIDQYTRSLRVFFRWAHRHEEMDDFPFWKQVKTATAEFTPPSEREFPDQDDYEGMMEVARGNPRNQAILAFFWATGVRATLAAQLRRQDVNLPATMDDNRATFTPNADGTAQKGIPIKSYPFYDGIDVLRQWKHNHHPDPDNPEAPFFTIHFYDVDNPQEGALSPSRMSSILNELAEEAGVDSEIEINPHAFRHALVGRCKEQGYSLPQVQRRVAWADRAAAKMWGRYGNPDDEAIDREIDKLEGRDPASREPDEEATPPERKVCDNCGAGDITTSHCGECGWPIDEEARADDVERMLDKDAVTEFRQDMIESAAMEEGETAEAIAELESLFDEYPVLRAMALGES